jgi:hypothetical protein
MTEALPRYQGSQPRQALEGMAAASPVRECAAGSDAILFSRLYNSSALMIAHIV